MGITPHASLYRVVKKFDADGETLFQGDIVDASAWRYAKQLVSLRYITLAPDEEETSRVERVVVAPKKIRKITKPREPRVSA